MRILANGACLLFRPLTQAFQPEKCGAGQSAAGSHYRSRPHPGNGHGIVSLPPDSGKTKERSQAALIGKPWKWRSVEPRKTKSRFSILPTDLGNRCSDSLIPTASTATLIYDERPKTAEIDQNVHAKRSVAARHQASGPTATKRVNSRESYGAQLLPI
jgi:hypothetical protein